MFSAGFGRWCCTAYHRGSWARERPRALIARELQGIIDRRQYLRQPSSFSYLSHGQGLMGFVDARWLAVSDEHPVAYLARDRWTVFVDSERIVYLGYYWLEGHAADVQDAWAATIAVLDTLPIEQDARCR